MAALADVLRGQIPTIILRELLVEDSYGYHINRDIQEKLGGRYELKEATLYSAFRRLEKDGFISSYWGDEDAGARRRYYTITDKGRAAYEANRAEWDELKLLIDGMIAPQQEEEKTTKKKRGILG